MSVKQERNTPTPGKKFITENQGIYTKYSVDSSSSGSKLLKKEIHAAPIHEVCTGFYCLKNLYF
jgi:hypothetical protein